MSGSDLTPRRSGQWSLITFVAALTAAALTTAVLVAPLPAPSQPIWWTLPVFACLLVAATWFVVPFRYGQSVDAVNLLEAALAPVLLAFPPLAVVAVLAVSQVANGLLRGLPPIKTAFNTAMWSVAGGSGALVVAQLAAEGVAPRILALVAALAVVGVINNLAFAIVVALAERDPVRQMAARFLPVIRLAWVGGWTVNAALGVLFSLAYLAAPAATPLFAVPLLVLHLAYRSYSAARADQALLVAAHNAAANLATPLYPLTAVPRFLHDVAECFAAAAVELVVANDTGGRDIHVLDRTTGSCSTRSEGRRTTSLEAVVSATPGPVHAACGRDDAVSRMLGDLGVSTCLAAPLRHGDRLVGAIIVLDRSGFDGSAAGELAVLEALAREVSSALAKGRLLAEVLDERRQLGEIVDSTSDGILTLSGTGRVLTWNNALERITGMSADDMVDRADLAVRLRLRTLDGQPVFLGAPLNALPTDLLITAADGTTRHLTCSYSPGSARAAGAAVVVVARDVTPDDEHAALRETVTRMVEVEAERRLVVEQLQEAVLPAPISLPGATAAATYEASDPSAPTGGDLYDWQLLPSGEVHVAVVDALGHGVAATKDALAVIHTLRVVTAQGTPLEDVVTRTHELLQVQSPDLVATVIVARYEPSTGRLRIASGGHPPALVVTPRRDVRQIAASGGVVGWPGAGSDGVAETVLEPGDALILYTDGLVEARRNILDGMDDLERHAHEAADLPADELAHELVSRALAGADRRDDTLALVLRRDLVAAPAERASWTISPDPVAVRQLRNTVASWLSQRHVERDDAMVAAAELLSNAARAARTRVSLHISLAGGSIVLDVADDGAADPGVSRRGAALPSPDAEGGRGLYVVRAICSRVDVLTTAEGTTIRAVVPSRAAAPELPQPRTAAGAGAGVYA